MSQQNCNLIEISEDGVLDIKSLNMDGLIHDSTAFISIVYINVDSYGNHLHSCKIEKDGSYSLRLDSKVLQGTGLSYPDSSMNESTKYYLASCTSTISSDNVERLLIFKEGKLLMHIDSIDGRLYGSTHSSSLKKFQFVHQFLESLNSIKLDERH